MMSFVRGARDESARIQHHFNVSPARAVPHQSNDSKISGAMRAACLCWPCAAHVLVRFPIVPRARYFLAKGAPRKFELAMCKAANCGAMKVARVQIVRLPPTDRTDRGLCNSGNNVAQRSLGDNSYPIGQPILHRSGSL